jgi:drug/metabolite transporter (DMT)-like permease
MAVLLGTLVAIGLGTSDFCGGFASRRSAPTAALLTAQVTSLCVAALLVLGSHTPSPSGRLIAWSVVSGVATAGGLACLYRGLARGRMSVVAPVSAVGSGLVPMLWGIVRHGESPGTAAVVGAAVALAAVALIARTQDTDHHAGGRAGALGLAVGAGLSFGIAVVALAEVQAEGSFWPVLIGRVAGVALILAALLAVRAPLVVDRRDRPFAIAAGALEATCTALLIVAFRHGLTSVVAPAAALYPAATVLLARAVLHERVGRIRAYGLALALVGLVLVAS